MLRILVESQLEQVLRVRDDGVLDVDVSTMGAIVKDSLGLDSEPCVAMTGCDYRQDTDGQPVLSSRAATGIWWLPEDEDVALVGRWTIENRTLRLDEEGRSTSPVSSDDSLLAKVTERLLPDFPDGEVIRPGVIFHSNGMRSVRVFVVRDGRITRPSDLLHGLEIEAFRAGVLGIITVMLLAEDKAIVRKMGF